MRMLFLNSDHTTKFDQLILYLNSFKGKMSLPILVSSDGGGW
jgi:hypothetical protein